MRLIDADELMTLLRARKDSGIGTDIEEVPTVDAIPIKWLKEKAIEYGCFIFTLNDMIKDWEKENES